MFERGGEYESAAAVRSRKLDELNLDISNFYKDGALMLNFNNFMNSCAVHSRSLVKVISSFLNLCA